MTKKSKNNEKTKKINPRKGDAKNMSEKNNYLPLNFRTLTPEEIECKAVVVKSKIEIALHIKAVTCTRILNETVGSMNWEKEYTNGNKNCIVRIWDYEKERMISKEDCGGPLTEINGHKGQASNGFKRVCELGWGLGIELYTQPKILFPITDDNVIYEKNEIVVCEKYAVKEIKYDENRKITKVVIIDSNGTVVYDGPNENGESNIEYPVEEAEDLIIPEDADMQNDEYVDETEDDEEDVPNKEEAPIEYSNEAEELIEELPDNTDGFSDVEEDFMTQETPFGTCDYKKEFEREIKRTNTKKTDVLKVLGISSFNEVNTVEETLLDETLKKLQARPTFKK